MTLVDSAPLDGAELQRMALAVVRSLDGLHRAGAVHGNVCPETVLLDGLSDDRDPEQFWQADMYGWAACVVFAATGRADEPDATGLPEPLGALVATCLSPNPGDRLKAHDVSRLLATGESATRRRLLTDPRPPRRETPQPVKRRRWVWPLAGAVVIAAGGAAAAVALQQKPVVVVAPPTPSPSPVGVPVPEAGLTLFERPDDPARLSAYRLGQDTYVRRKDRFVKVKGTDPAFTRDGAWLALLDGNSVRIHDLVAGKRFVVRLRGPAEGLAWSPDGTRLLLTTERGFLLVDRDSRTPSLVRTSGDSGAYTWQPDGKGVAAGAEQGVRLRDLTGEQTAIMPWEGSPLGYSPGGNRLLTGCGAQFCVWDVATGTRLATFDAGVDGWFDDTRLIVDGAIVNVLRPATRERELVRSDGRDLQPFYASGPRL